MSKNGDGIVPPTGWLFLGLLRQIVSDYPRYYFQVLLLCDGTRVMVWMDLVLCTVKISSWLFSFAIFCSICELVSFTKLSPKSKKKNITLWSFNSCCCKSSDVSIVHLAVLVLGDMKKTYYCSYQCLVTAEPYCDSNKVGHGLIWSRCKKCHPKAKLANQSFRLEVVKGMWQSRLHLRGRKTLNWLLEFSLTFLNWISCQNTHGLVRGSTGQDFLQM